MLNNNVRPTPQEIRVLKAVIECGTVQAAAQKLSLSYHTLDTHIDHLRSKSGRKKIAQIIAWAMEQGWLNAETEEPKKIE